MFDKYLNVRYLNIIKTLFFTNNFICFLHRTHVNLENYTPTVERNFSDTIVYSPKHYSFKVTDIAKVKMGRWNPNPESDYFLSNLSDSSSYIVDVDLETGIEELKKEGKEIDIDVLGNPVSRNTRFRISTNKYLEHGEIYIYNMLGKVVDKIEIDNLLPNEEKEIEYSGVWILTQGTYILRFSGNNSVSSEILQKL